MKILSRCLFVLLGLVALAAATEDSTPSDNGSAVSLHVINQDVQDLARLYEELSQQKVILDNSVHGKITGTASEGLGREKAIDLVERIFFINGYTIIQVDPVTVEIMGWGKNSGRVPTISQAKDLPTHERLVSFLFTFKYRNAAEMQKVFAQYLSPPNYYVSFLPEQGVNAFWLTERSSVIRRLIEAAEKLDVAEAGGGR